MAISETWLNIQTEERLVSVPGYKFHRADRQLRSTNGQIKSGGGLGIYCKQEHQLNTAELMGHKQSGPHLELQWAILTWPHTNKILLGNVYRPPDGSQAEAVEQLNNSLSNIPTLDKYEILIMGDFNIDYKAKAQPPTRILNQFAISHNLKQRIEQPTRVTKTT
jgi:hypothetical protein